MKKLLSLLLALTMVLSLAACGGSDDKKDDANTNNESASTKEDSNKDDAEPMEDKAEAKELVVWAWDPNFNVDIMNRAAEAYEAANEGVDVVVVDMAKGDLEQKLQTMLAAGTTKDLPDIVLTEDYNAQKYLQAFPGSFLDLTGKVNHSEFAPYKVELMTIDGSVYGVPFDSGVTGMYYRTDVLEEAGYSAADLENITWDRYIEIGEDVHAKTGKYWLAADPIDGGIIRIMLNGAASWYFDAEGNIAIKGNEALAASLDAYARIINSPMTKKTSGWGEWVGAINGTDTEDGDTATITSGVWITGSVKAGGEKQSGKWALAPTPRLDLPNAVNASNLGGSSWYVLSTSANQDMAVDFLNTTYTNADFYQTILVNNGAVGSYLPSAEGEAYNTEDEYFGGQKVYTEFTKMMEQIPPLNYGMYTYEADAAIMAAIATVYAGGTVEEALEAAEEQVALQIQ